MNDYDPHTNTETYVYDKDGVELDRFDGIVTVSGKDYDEYLPIEVVQKSTTIQILNVTHIYPKGGQQ